MSKNKTEEEILIIICRGIEEADKIRSESSHTDDIDKNLAGLARRMTSDVLSMDTVPEYKEKTEIEEHEPTIPEKSPDSVDINYNCTLAKMAEQVGIKLWQAMVMMKYSRTRES